MRKVEKTVQTTDVGGGYTSVATFQIANGNNGLMFRVDGDRVYVDLSMAPGPLFCTGTLDNLREDLERNGMTERDLDDVLDTIAEKVYTTVIAKRLAENIKRG